MTKSKQNEVTEEVVTNEVIIEQAQETIEAATEVISEKAVVEYLPVEGYPVVEGEAAFVQTLGPLDTVTSLSVPAGFTGIVTSVSDGSFETETNIYTEVK